MPDGISVQALEDIYQWEAVIPGPPGTAYEGAEFHVAIDFLPTTEHCHYPFCAPIVRFTTPIYHCNVAPSGEMCFSDDLGDDWHPGTTISKAPMPRFSGCTCGARRGGECRDHVSGTGRWEHKRAM